MSKSAPFRIQIVTKNQICYNVLCTYAQAKATKDVCHLLVAADWLRDRADANSSSSEGKTERKKTAKGLLQCEAIVREVGDVCTEIYT